MNRNNWSDITYHDIKYELQYLWMHYSQQVRQHIIDELNSISLPTTHIQGTDNRFSVDYSNSFYKCGDKCVYVCVTQKGQIFYIGMGDTYRPTNYASRTKQFKDVYDLQNIKSFLIATNGHKSDMQSVQTLCIWLAQTKGWELCNKSKTLTAKQLATIIDKKESDVYNRFCELQEDYPEVVTAFHDLNNYCICSVSLEQKAFDDNTQRCKISGKRKRSIRNVWEIDGQIKCASQWCKQYNRNYTTVKNYMQLGCTPKQSLTFPKMPDVNRPKGVSVVQFWKEKGFVPGTDKTSKVLRWEQYPYELKYVE